MKTRTMFAAIVAVIGLSFTTVKAKSNEFVTNDTQNEKGQTVQRVICESNGSYLTPYRMIQCKYDEKGNLIEKNTMKWSIDDNKWYNFEITRYDYSQNPVKVTALEWDEKSKEYTSK